MIQLPSARHEYHDWVSVVKPLLVSQAQTVSSAVRAPWRAPEVMTGLKVGALGSLERRQRKVSLRVDARSWPLRAASEARPASSGQAMER